MAVKAPEMAHQCGFTLKPASNPNSTMMGSAATSVDSHQWPSGSYTWVQFVTLSFSVWSAAEAAAPVSQTGSNSPSVIIASPISLARRKLSGVSRSFMKDSSRRSLAGCNSGGAEFMAQFMAPCTDLFILVSGTWNRAWAHGEQKIFGKSPITARIALSTRFVKD